MIERGHLAFAERARLGARGDGGETAEWGGFVAWASGTTDFAVLVNGAVAFDELVDAEAAVAEARRFFGSKRRGHTLLVRDLRDRDRDWEAAIERAGIRLGLARHPVLVCRKRLPDREWPDGAELRPVNDRETFMAFCDVQADAFPALGFPEPAVRSVLTPDYVLGDKAIAWIAYLDDEPSAAAMTIVTDAIGGIVWVGTIEKARGRGLAEACTRAVTNSGFDRGAEVAWLEASFMGEPTYRRMGFEFLFAYKLYVAQASA